VKKVNKEHAAIFSAITQADAKAARNTLALHLEESLNRYQAMLNRPAPGSSAV